MIQKTLSMPLVIGAVFVITAGIMYFFPPKKINYIYGYRTARSMSSQERWAFAQRYSTVRLLQAGIFLILLSLTGFFISADEVTEVFLGLVPALLSCFYIFYTTENALRSKFPNT